MRSKNSDLVLLSALLLGGVGAFTACGESPEERRAAVRAEAAREFGRPTDDGAAEAGSGAPGDPAGESTDVGPASGDGSGEATPAGDGDSSQTPGSGDASPSASAPGQTGDPDRVPPGDEPAVTDAEAADLSTPRTDEVPADASGGGAPDGAAAGQESQAAAILADADRAYSGLTSLRAMFVQRVEVPLLDRTSQGHGQWLQEGRDRFRMDFTEPAGDLFLADGEYLWLYQPSATAEQVLQCELAGGRREAGGADVLARILSEARVSYDSRLVGTQLVSGVRTHEIELTPRGPSEYRQVRIWIAETDDLVRRFRIVEENETIRTVTLADLEPNVAIDDGLFVFIKPDEAEVFDC